MRSVHYCSNEHNPLWNCVHHWMEKEDKKQIEMVKIAEISAIFVFLGYKILIL